MMMVASSGSVLVVCDEGLNDERPSFTSYTERGSHLNVELSSKQLRVELACA